MAAVYVPRSPTTSVLYGVVRANLSALVAAVEAETDGVGLPGFVVNEFRKFLRCGVLSYGFARVRCANCALERLVPFSCKGRAICTSCGGRRMMERAAHLVDHVIPADIPVRQWVLSVPHRLRYRLAYDHRLCRTVLEHLCQYLCRPPLGQGRLRELRDGRIAVALQRPWADGTTHLVFTPLELLQRLVPLVPRPRINLLLYHGVLAPNAPWRREVVARAEPEAGAVDSCPPATPPNDEAAAANPGCTRPKYRAWADLMRRAFEADVLSCPRCGGRMTVIATIARIRR